MNNIYKILMKIGVFDLPAYDVYFINFIQTLIFIYQIKFSNLHMEDLKNKEN
jgi:hypothetical protein